MINGEITIEIIDENEYLEILQEGMIYDGDELEETDFEDERIIECQKKK